MPTTFRVFPTIAPIIANFKGILLDAYGVFWGGNAFGLLPGAKESMENLIAQGKIVGILSNTSHLVSKEIDKLHRHGIEKGKHFHFLLTSGEVIRQILLNETLPFATPRETYWVFGGDHPEFSFHEPIFLGSRYRETSTIQEADFIYLSVPHIQGKDQTDSEVFHAQVHTLKQSNLPMICSNPDRFAHEGMPPRAVVRQGMIASMYEELGGQVFYTGKPYPKVYLKAMQYFEQHAIHLPSDILMVGDTPETDIRGARGFGMSSALVTHTGIMADRISRFGFENTVDNLSADDQPHFLIERL
jgi:HAD superfamily hydrolase (TIGR01459 family)